MTDTVRSLLVRALGLAVGQVLDDTPRWAGLLARIDENGAQLRAIGEALMALTQNEQKTVNDLSQAIATLSANLADVLAAGRSVAAQLQAMTAEEMSEEQRRTTAEAALAQMEADVVDALTPMTAAVTAMNASLATPPDQGGGPLTPTA